jgi:hypothetical protein
MAASSGTPPQATTKTKREFTPEQKRLFAMLGVMGVLALGVGVVYLPGLLGGSGDGADAASTTTTTTTETTTTPAATPPTEVGAEAGSGSEGIGAPGAITTVSAPGAAGAAAFGTVPRHRVDPFQPFVIITPPLPEPPPPPRPRPTPTPQPPVSIPLPPAEVPFAVPQPGGRTVGLPGVRAVEPIEQQPLVLPSVSIPRLNANVRAPRDPFPPPRSTGAAGGSGEAQPSFDKRLSGVVISNGVRALLEINSGPEPKTYIVQPGDTVEGITVLNIQRYSEGTRTITRMLVREGGQQRYIDLKAGAPRALGGVGGEGLPGRPPGGF